MDALLNGGLAWIVFLQGLGSWLTLPMKFFTFMGSEDFFMLVLPVLYWCVDAALGLRVGVILLVGSNLNDAFKLAFHSPRPYWVSGQVKGLASESSFGVPSGHALSAVNVWGMLAAQIRKTWGWIVAVIIMLLIGLSRMVLGVHFPLDVFTGWVLGALILWLVLRWWGPVGRWLNKFSLAGQVLLIFAGTLLLMAPSLVMATLLKSSGWSMPTDWLKNIAQAFPGGETPNPISLTGLFSNSGALFGLGAGWIWLKTRGGFSAGGPWWQRLLRFVVGVVGVLIIRYGLKAILPSGEGWIGLSFQYLRYACIGAWVAVGAPMLFFALKLANRDLVK